MLVPYQRGGTYPVFIGKSYQRGRGFGSIMSSVFRNLVVPAAKNVGKSLLRTGLKKASNVMRGVAHGKNIKRALMDEVAPLRNMVYQVAQNPRPRNTPSAGRGRGRGRGGGRVNNVARGTKRAASGRRGQPRKRARTTDIFG